MKFLKFCNLRSNLPYHIVVMDRSHGALKLTHNVINALRLHTYHTHSPGRPGAYVRMHTRTRTHAHTYARTHTHARTRAHACTRTHTHTH